MNDLARYDSVPVDKLRDRVIDDLVKQYSLERIDLNDFERRTELASKAATRGELVALVSDLPALDDSEGRAAGRQTAGRTVQGASWSVASGNVRPNDVSIAIFGGSEFKGIWRAPRRLSTLCVFGGSNIDLRKAVIPEEGVTISCVCAFGGADIIVPPGLRLVVRGIGIFGGFDRTSNEADDPYAPTIVVEGIAVFGGVSVKIRD